MPLDPVDAAVDEHHGFRRVPDGKDGTQKLIQDGDAVEVGEYPVIETSLQELGTLGGAGLRMYFALVKLFCVTFFAMGFVTLPTLFIHWRGSTEGSMYDMPAAKAFDSLLARTTLGSIRASVEDLDAGNVPQLWILSSIDALVCLLLAALIVVNYRKKAQLLEDTDFSMVSMGDYTVWIKPVDEIKAWPAFKKKDSEIFAKHLRHYLESTICNDTEQPVRVADITEDGTTRAAIWPIWDEDENISLWNQKRQAIYDLEAALAACVKTKKTGILDSKLKKLEKINDKLLETAKIEFHAIGAFVTFENDDDYETALEWSDHRHVKESLSDQKSGKDEAEKDVKNLHFQYDKDFEGQHINIVQAPEPEVLMWSNLEYVGFSLSVRRLAVNLGALLFLLVGGALILGANNKKEVWMQSILPSCPQYDEWGVKNGTHYCDGLELNLNDNSHLGESHAFKNETLQAAKFYHQAWGTVNRELDSLKVPNFPFIQDPLTNDCRVDGTSSTTSCCKDGAASWEKARDSGCSRVDNSGGYPFKDRSVVKGGSRDAICYACVCSQRDEYSQLIDATGTFDYCKDYDRKMILTLFWSLASVAAVVVVNQAVKVGMEQIVVFSKNDTTGAEQGDLAIQIFVAQFMNTAVLVVLVRADLDFLSFIPGDKYHDTNAEMYSRVLSPLVITLCSTFLAPPSSAIFQEFFVNRGLKRVLSLFAKTQNQLNFIQEDDVMKVASNYGECLMGLCTTLLYCSAMPILYWVAGFGFLYKYWGDKWAVLRAFRKPPLYGSDLFDSLEEILLLALTMHAGAGWYFLSMAGGVDPKKSIPRNFFRPHCLPIMVVFCMLLAVIVSAVLFQLVTSKTRCGRKRRIRLRELLKGTKESLERKGTCINLAMDVKIGVKRLLRGLETIVDVTATVLQLGTDEIEAKLKQEQQMAAETDPENKGEVLPPFSQVLKRGMIVNEDDDYYMDEDENMTELCEAFMKNVHSRYTQVQTPRAAAEVQYEVFPFTDRELAERIFDAVKDHMKHKDQSLETYDPDSKEEDVEIGSSPGSPGSPGSLPRRTIQMEAATYTVTRKAIAQTGYGKNAKVIRQLQVGEVIIAIGKRQCPFGDDFRLKFVEGGREAWVNMKSVTGHDLLVEGGDSKLLKYMAPQKLLTELEQERAERERLEGEVARLTQLLGPSTGTRGRQPVREQQYFHDSCSDSDDTDSSGLDGGRNRRVTWVPAPPLSASTNPTSVHHEPAAEVVDFPPRQGTERGNTEAGADAKSERAALELHQQMDVEALQGRQAVQERHSALGSTVVDTADVRSRETSDETATTRRPASSSLKAQHERTRSWLSTNADNHSSSSATPPAREPQASYTTEGITFDFAPSAAQALEHKPESLASPMSTRMARIQAQQSQRSQRRPAEKGPRTKRSPVAQTKASSRQMPSPTSMAARMSRMTARAQSRTSAP